MKPEPNWIYVIAAHLDCDHCCRIKVGVADSFAHRTDQIRRQNDADETRLLRFFRGSLEHEKQIHEYLANRVGRSHHEWFYFPPEHRAEILEWIDRFASETNQTVDAKNTLCPI